MAADHRLETPIWLSWRHVKTLCSLSRMYFSLCFEYHARLRLQLYRFCLGYNLYWIINLWCFCYLISLVFLAISSGVDFQIKTMSIENRCIALQLWDTAGQERWASFQNSLFVFCAWSNRLWVTNEQQLISCNSECSLAPGNLWKLTVRVSLLKIKNPRIMFFETFLGEISPRPLRDLKFAQGWYWS